MNEPRVHRLLELWAWLPAFRFVAETEHLPSASDLLYTSPSALSRTVKQLEGALGVKLFDRVGKRLVLNDDGRRLLGGVRRAMRYVDDVFHLNFVMLEHPKLSRKVLQEEISTSNHIWNLKEVLFQNSK